MTIPAIVSPGLPVSLSWPLTVEERKAAAEGRLGIVSLHPGGEAFPAQADGDRVCFVPGGVAANKLVLQATPFASQVRAQRNPATGQWDVTEDGRPVLTYNYQTNDPGEVLKSVSAGNLKYARARSDYIHPLHGLDGEVLTKDWSVDHPHHRGIYWAWPEVDYGTNRGDLHALQRVFARPAGGCSGRSGPVFAQIEATNLWLWEDREPIVRERALIRVWHSGDAGRFVDLEFHFTALQPGVTVARRETDKYGGLNVRLSAVKDQAIAEHTDPAGASPRMAWAQLSGVFPSGTAPATLAIFQHQMNPDYPGAWIKYPELNWLQPTFPANGTRYALKPGQPLKLRYRLWIHRGGLANDEACAAQWRAANDSATNPPSP